MDRIYLTNDGESVFLRDLKRNHWRIRLFLQADREGSEVVAMVVFLSARDPNKARFAYDDEDTLYNECFAQDSTVYTFLEGRKAVWSSRYVVFFAFPLNSTITIPM
jgi:hypothetical protein